MLCYAFSCSYNIPVDLIFNSKKVLIDYILTILKRINHNTLLEYVLCKLWGINLKLLTYIVLELISLYK